MIYLAGQAGSPRNARIMELERQFRSAMLALGRTRRGDRPIEVGDIRQEIHEGVIVGIKVGGDLA